MKTSIRDRGAIPDADCVIKPDTTAEHSRNNSYQIWTYGHHVGTEYTVAAAKAHIEAVYGPLPWRKVGGDTRLHHDRVWGHTDEFNDSTWHLVVDKLPRLGSVRGAVAQAAIDRLSKDT